MSWQLAQHRLPLLLKCDDNHHINRAGHRNPFPKAISLFFDEPADEPLNQRGWVRKAVSLLIWVSFIQALSTGKRLLPTFEQPLKDILNLLVAWQAVIAPQRLDHLIRIPKWPVGLAIVQQVPILEAGVRDRQRELLTISADNCSRKVRWLMCCLTVKDAPDLFIRQGLRLLRPLSPEIDGLLHQASGLSTGRDNLKCDGEQPFALAHGLEVPIFGLYALANDQDNGAPSLCRCTTA